MTDWEWPPDEISGPGEDSKPAARGQGTRASAPVPRPDQPMAGVPIAVPAPQAGIPLAGPQPVAGGADLTATMPVPLPPRGQSSVPVPLPPTAVPVQPHSAPIPLPQTGSAPIPAPPVPAPQSGAIPAPPQRPADQQGGLPPVPAPPATPAPQRPPVTAVPPPQTAPGVWPVASQQNPHVPPLPPMPATPTPQQAPQFGNPQQPTAAGEVYLPTAEEFARRRAQRPADPVAHMGIQAALRKTTFGLVNLSPGQREQEVRRATDLVRRNFGGLRQITVVNPKGGAGKTVAVLLLAMTFGRKRGGYVLAWDNNETQGTLGMRSQQDFHSRTVRDLLRDLHQFQGAQSRVGDLSQYVRAQGDGMFEVLASDESATAGEMLTAHAFAEIREVVSRFYKLIMVDTGNNVRAENWQAAIDATDQLVVTMSARNDSAETAARMLDHLEQTGRSRLVRQAVTIVSLPPSRRELDIPAIERHFAARTRAVLIAPYERMLDSGEPIDYARLSEESQDAWLRIAASVAEGL
ncbi:MinD/ParA family ATP-binding protein [Catellatospora bangladeshensis]|uniref:Chromosome partitioning protein n=1 Tax=Catellatospora bangladeshensis TaxID=310355 RepID=A0A8J3NMD5_9ACTN|nr:chromosome partitioning protein [Catellatospora bangladeshensis]GIF83570.1 chromosome partitioning protein [Catellatospora bangladeshensis]